MIKTKSVRTSIDRARDGLRILVTRFRGRGMPTTRYDVWMPSLGPSEKLLRSYLAGTISWPDYKRVYIKELFDSTSLDKRNVIIKNHGQKFTLRLIKRLSKQGNVTLLCHCAEEELHCHRHLLKQVLLSTRI
jgi:uncharacterized protein YeaO (DUF488 family)